MHLITNNPLQYNETSNNMLFDAEGSATYKKGWIEFLLYFSFTLLLCFSILNICLAIKYGSLKKKIFILATVTICFMLIFFNFIIIDKYFICSYGTAYILLKEFIVYVFFIVLVIITAVSGYFLYELTREWWYTSANTQAD